MESKIMSVTPDMAREWLKLNIDHNRKINDNRIRTYANDMKNGRWQLNGESIRFNKSGKLIDGQHRLMAIIRAGCTIEISVTFGIDDTVNIYDNGYPRRSENMLQMAGIRATRKHTSAARALLEMVSSHISVGAVNQFVEENMDTLSNALTLADKKNNGQTILRRANIAAAAWVILVNGYERETIERFFDVAASGFYNDTGETAAVAFRNFILGLNYMTHSGSQWRKQRQAEFEACLKAFADFCVRKPRKKPYGLKDFGNNDIFRGSVAETILKRYGSPQSDAEAESSRTKESLNTSGSTLNWRDQEAGEILRSARKDAKLSLSDLGRAIGYDPSIISRWETGAYHMADLQRKAICDYFHRDIFAEATVTA